jgi:translation initiation factor IF-1
VGWADSYIAQLRDGHTIQFRPRGHSMQGRIASGDLVTVEPVGEHRIRKGDIVLCRVRGSQYLHLVKAVRGDRLLIGNNRGHTNGWTSTANVFGRCTKVEP